MPLCYSPKPGHAWNPLKQYPRNEKCFCGSSEKAKKCCLPFIAATCTIEEFENHSKILAFVKKFGAEKVFAGYKEKKIEMKDPYFEEPPCET